ncbi:MAG TPA: TlpA disulfide reductase family protein [Dongiaceae bacterium]|nr:TlpA disulfide reductase family protein [Dongiaceae bacterium]
MRRVLAQALAAAAIVVVAAAGGAWWWSQPAPVPKALVQSEMPQGFKAVEPPLQMGDLAFEDGDGKTVRLSDFRGRPVILNIWAKWCAPCVVELPQLNDLQAKGGTLAVVAVAVDEPDPTKVRGFLINRGLTALEPYLDPKNVFAKALNIRSIPVSMLIDKDGYALVRVDAPVHWFGADAVALLQRTIL